MSFTQCDWRWRVPIDPTSGATLPLRFDVRPAASVRPATQPKAALSESRDSLEPGGES